MLKLFDQIAFYVNDLHYEGILHSDLTPKNILVRQ